MILLYESTPEYLRRITFEGTKVQLLSYFRTFVRTFVRKYEIKYESTSGSTVLLPSTKVQYREVRCTKVRKYREVRYVVRKYNYCTVRVQNNNLIFSKVLKVVTKVSTTNNVVYTIVQRCTRTYSTY